MTWTGTPVIVKVSDRKFRITGISLTAADGSASIGLIQNADNVDIALTAPEWGRYRTSGIDSANVSMQDSVEVTTRPNYSVLSVAKTGDSPEDFRIGFVNTSEATTIEFTEIYIEFH